MIIKELDEWLKTRGYRLVEYRKGRYGKKYLVKFRWSSRW